MAEKADRDTNEAAIATALSRLFSDTRQRLDAGERVNWDEFAAQVRAAQRAEYARVFVVMYLLLASEQLQNRTLLADSRAEAYAASQARQVAAGLVANVRRELAAGGRPDVVLSETRASVLAATEVTRAVSAGEEAARQDNASQREETTEPTRPGRTLGEAGRAALIPDGLMGFWVTERDEKVCPICQPLDGQAEPNWRAVFAAGPPAHPNCRCYIRYEAAS